jgi:hypothetical protein
MSKYSDFWLHKFGRNPSVSGSCDIWDFGSNYIFPTAATTTQIVGGASDLPSSDGVHTVQVEGLDVNGAAITEVATLNGTTPVILANSYYRVNRAFVLSTGGDTENAANIDISHSGSATLARISAGEGQTLQAIYTMPQSATGSLLRWGISGNKVAINQDFAASIRLQSRKPGASWRTQDSLELVNGTYISKEFAHEQAMRLDPMNDVRIRVVAVSTSAVALSGGFDVAGQQRR